MTLAAWLLCLYNLFPFSVNRTWHLLLTNKIWQKWWEVTLVTRLYHVLERWQWKWRETDELKKIQKAKLRGFYDVLEIKIWKREVSKLTLRFLSWSFSGIGNIDKWSDLRERSMLVSEFCMGMLYVHVCGSPELWESLWVEDLYLRVLVAIEALVGMDILA